MLKKFFELVGMATTGYVAYKVYDEYKARQKYVAKEKEEKKEEETVEDYSVEVEDFFDETVAE